ncbi:MAG: two-component system, NarL family, sensor histidine kinase UhpB [Thermomicrobiales bacterium]|jgi:two-component system sensor histidine kinase UhpB|nr:two-component system, NarL family, sensor histidine kinase UhpB [Thermomicrobiales bacterium]MEA2587020.1 two-component system, NarL family, sensor histidine kinase UhpB [Thermomicrobiales bacterium]
MIDVTAVHPQSLPQVLRQTDLPVSTDPLRAVPRAGNRLGGLPILYKVLIANAAIVALGAIAGTWLTIQTVRHAAHHQFFGLAASFVAVGIIASIVVNYVVLRAAFRPLATLEQTALAVRGGDLSARAAPTSFMDPQVAHLAETFNATLDELARDRAELRTLASQVIRAQEDERRRIARELHDDTAQVLFAQLLRLTTLKASPDPGVHLMAATLEEMTVEALEGVRRLALELRPPALDDLGLSAALGELAQRFADQLNVPVDYQSRGLRGRLPSEVELVLYRVAQEALTNIAKHADASRVWLDVDRTGNDVTISIRDDGRGFDHNVSAASDGRGLGLGLFGMEERVALVGGRFRIWSRPGSGTEIFAFIPLTGDAGVAERSAA